MRNRFGLRVREPRSQTELLARDVGPFQHLHLHKTTQTQNAHVFLGVRSYDLILQEVKIYTLEHASTIISDFGQVNLIVW